jgi:aminoglycoside 6-adenylyltransferase
LRSEQEMMELILGTAREDERIRAVYMNGSRANPDAPKDIFQDYDIVYVVTETASFLADKRWIDRFGKRIILQEPDLLDRMLGRSVDFSQSYCYLMQFTDGNRIDLTLASREYARKNYGTDSLTVPLLDKDGLLPPLPPSSDRDYRLGKPDFARYHSRCNNFWWVAPYCAKGLWRREILYASDTMNKYVREELLLMLGWYVRLDRGFDLCLGKSWKYLQRYLDDSMWSRLMETYNWSDYDAGWNALTAACELFAEVAPAVGKSLGYEYDREEAEASFAFVRHIRSLPRDAAGIF